MVSYHNFRGRFSTFNGPIQLEVIHEFASCWAEQELSQFAMELVIGQGLIKGQLFIKIKKVSIQVFLKGWIPGIHASYDVSLRLQSFDQVMYFRKLPNDKKLGFAINDVIHYILLI